MENPIKIDDLGVPLFLETPMSLQKRKSSTTLGTTQRINGLCRPSTGYSNYA